MIFPPLCEQNGTYVSSSPSRRWLHTMAYTDLSTHHILQLMPIFNWSVKEGPPAASASETLRVVLAFCPGRLIHISTMLHNCWVRTVWMWCSLHHSTPGATQTRAMKLPGGAKQQRTCPAKYGGKKKQFLSDIHQIHCLINVQEENT